ncbi:transcriptional regulator family: bZIP [Trichoderma aggressivum f. europaeum]|uniref:Transcriptional regulator family: bZIP n=1 Tax=Trichoderma aggressivum f. europaeum TaxID=173218 RepID=A0AAE1J7Q0_9HYPO|nr:transcriptional regulator family: bZIP [Trichoderma aggressivum f. europaeum]
MAFQQSPLLKFEASPAESFLSAPGDNFSSLFADSSSIPSTLNPKEMMTPDSFADDRLDSRLSAIPESPEADMDDMDTPAAAEHSSSEKKPVKKRKSWGQVLPEPKTNLPPRKRAKTEDEKEQRRVERVLRNRRAAQSSRERKRLEVEALEKRNKELETLLHNAQKTNLILVEELNRFRRSSGVVTRSSSPLDSLQDNITLSQQLFGSQDGQNITTEQSLMDQMMRSAVNPTVNPASLSPALTPIPDKESPHEEEEQEEEAEEEEGEEEEKTIEQTVSTDSTQRPAEMFLGSAFGLSTALDADRYVLESSLLASPNSSTLDDDYMAGDSATCFTNPLSDYDFDINDFLTDDANHAAYDIVAARNYAAADHELDLEIHDLETQISSDYPIQQPQSGASSLGCDDGGIAGSPPHPLVGPKSRGAEDSTQAGRGSRSQEKRLGRPTTSTTSTTQSPISNSIVFQVVGFIYGFFVYFEMGWTDGDSHTKGVGYVYVRLWRKAK